MKLVQVIFTAALLSMFNGTRGSAFTASPNILINPSMEIDQEHEGKPVAAPSTGASIYVLDDWLTTFRSASAAVSCQRVKDAPQGFTYSFKCTVNKKAANIADGDYLILNTVLEGQQLTSLSLGSPNAGNVCLSWYVKASIGNYWQGFAMNNALGTRSHSGTVLVPKADEWTPEEACFKTDTAGKWVTSGNALAGYITFTAAVGNQYRGPGDGWSPTDYCSTARQTNDILLTDAATFQITGVKLEAGSVVTPFESRPYTEELALAQRYYETSFNGPVSGADTGGGHQNVSMKDQAGKAEGFLAFKVKKRCNPRITIYDDAGHAGKVSYFTSLWNNGGEVSELKPEPSGFHIQTLTNASQINFNYIADCRM